MTSRRYELVSSFEFFLIYTTAGISILTVVGLALHPKVEPFFAVAVGAIALLVGWWKVLFWNPILSLDVSASTVTLRFRRTPEVHLSRGNLAVMEECPMGGRQTFIGLRFHTRDGATYATWGIGNNIRSDLARHIATNLAMAIRDREVGARRWSV